MLQKPLQRNNAQSKFISPQYELDSASAYGSFENEISSDESITTTCKLYARQLPVQSNFFTHKPQRILEYLWWQICNHNTTCAEMFQFVWYTYNSMPFPEIMVLYGCLFISSLLSGYAILTYIQYSKGLDAQQTAFMVKKYKSHHHVRLPTEIIASMQA